MKTLLLLLLTVLVVHAEDAILSRSGSITRNNFTGEVGMKFAISEPLTVTHLARWVIAGNAEAHPVRIANASAVTVVSTSVPTAGLPEGFNYVPLSNVVTLQPGTYYAFSYEKIGWDKWFDDTNSISANPRVTILSSAFYDVAAKDHLPGKSYVPVSFRFNVVPPPAPIPIDFRYFFTWSNENPPGLVMFWTLYASNSVAVRAARTTLTSYSAGSILDGAPKGTYRIFGTATATNNVTSEAEDSIYVSWPGAKLKGAINLKAGK